MENTPQHTPGPWRYWPETNVITGEPEGITLFRIEDQGGQNYPETNARLIAAAPEVLEAIHLALTSIRDARDIIAKLPEFTGGVNSNEDIAHTACIAAINILNDAIAKATGKE